MSRLLFRRRRRRAASAASLRTGCRCLPASGILPGERYTHEGDESHDNERANVFKKSSHSGGILADFETLCTEPVHAQRFSQ